MIQRKMNLCHLHHHPMYHLDHHIVGKGGFLSDRAAAVIRMSAMSANSSMMGLHIK